MRLQNFPKVVFMPKLLTSLTILLLALSSTFFSASAQQSSRFPNDSRFDQIIEFQVGADGIKLEDYLRIIGKSVGLQVIPESIPDKTLGSAWSVKKPFRQVWDTLVTLYGLDYVLQPNNVVVVGPPSVIEKFSPTKPAQTTPASAQQNPTAPVTEIRTYVVSGDPVALKTFLESTYPTIKVTVPPNQKLLVITATPAEHTQVRELLAQVDKPLPTTSTVIPTELRTYTVNGDPVALKAFLESTFPSVKVSVPPNQKALIVNATVAEHDQIAKVLSQVDKVTPPTPVQQAPVIVPVTQSYDVNGDPSALKAFLESTYPSIRVTVPPNQKLIIVTATPDEQERVKNLLARVDIAQTVSAPTAAVVTEVKTYEVNGDPSALKVFLENTYPGIKVTVAPNQRILIVNATATEQAQVKQLLATVDKPTPIAAPVAPTQTVRKTFALSYAKASKIAAVLTQITAGTQPTATGTGAQLTVLPGTTASPATAAPIQVSIVADDDSNTLIVSGTSEQVDSIIAVLPSLDKPQSLVNIGIRIQEVTDSASRSLGIDWSLGLGNFSGSIVNGALSFLFDAGRSIAGLNIGAALNALETQKLSKKINDSTITVLNNGKGILKSGGRIEIQAPTTGTGTGTTLASRTLTYGVQLEVTPTVASNGDITMAVKANVSNVLDPNNTSSTRIDFTDRQSESTVRLKDGQTLLMGSLLSTSKDSTDQGIPVLSAIPLIGDLFKKSSSSSDQTQLLIVVTANIVK
jgi:type IV pilus assembly protein PilQ